MSTPTVRAVLITDGRSEHLPEVFAALAQLDVGPTSLQVVICGDAQPELPNWPGIEILHTEATGLAEAANEAVAAVPSDHETFVWLLHDDVVPQPSSLARLLATATKRQRAAVVGPLVVRMADASRIVNVGTTVTRLGARRVALAGDGEVNQGQYDAREDVLAVSLAGALVRREAWEALGGLDGGYEGFGESQEFCRRAWSTGWDVVIEPIAAVRHAQLALRGQRGTSPDARGVLSSHAARRAGEWHHALAWGTWWQAAVLATLLVPSALVRAALRLAQHSGTTALAELRVPVLVAAKAAAIRRSRAAHRRIGSRVAVPGRLFATSRQVIDQVRAREFGRMERERESRAPSGYIRSEVEAARLRHRRSGLVTLALGIGLSLAFGIGNLRDLAAGLAPRSAALGALNLPWRELWSRAWTGWSDAGLGSPGIDGAFAALMTPFAAAPGGLGLWVTLLLVAAPAAAAMTAWWAAGAATRSPFMRAAAALVYACWPPSLAAIADGRLGPVIAHATLPVIARGLASACGWGKGELIGGREHLPAPPPRPSAAMVASLALVLATVAQPVLLLPGVAAVSVVGAFAGRQRLRVWSATIAPLVIGLPGIVAAARQGSIAGALDVLARESGPAARSSQSTLATVLGISDVDRWAALFGNAQAVGSVAALTVLLAAVAALLSAGAWRATGAGLALVGAGIGIGVWSAGTIAVHPDGAGGAAIDGWAGTGASVVVLGALLATLAAHGELQQGAARRHAVGRVVAAGIGTAAVAAQVATAVFVAWPGAPRGDLDMVDSRVLPLAVPLEQLSTDRQRALVLQGRDDGSIAFTVLASDGVTGLAGGQDIGPDGTPLAGGASEPIAVLADQVAALVVSSAAPTQGLVEWGIGVVVVAPGDSAVETALSQNGELSLVSASERGTTYRIGEGTATRAWVDSGERRVALESAASAGSTAHVPDAGGTLVIAVAADSRWHAFGDGKELERASDPLGRAAFVVPPGTAEVAYSYVSPMQRWWRWLAVGTLLWAALGALPMRRPGDRA